MISGVPAASPCVSRTRLLLPCVSVLMAPFLLNLRDPSLQAPVSFCPCSLAQAVPTSSTLELMVRPSAVNKTTDYSETAVCLLCYPGEGNAPRGLGP